MNEALLSSKNMNWCTPQEFFEKLDEEFSFALDAAATEKSAKCNMYYTPETDGLKSPWNCGGGGVLQSSIRSKSWRVGQEGTRRSKKRYDDRSSYPVPDGHVIFSRLYIRESGNPFYSGPPEIHRRRRKATIKRERKTYARAVPVNGSYL